MPVRGRPFSVAVPVAVFVTVVALDQLAKTLVLRNIGLSERVDVVGPLSFVRRYNTGVAFSLGNGSAVTAWLVTIVVAALMFWVVRTISRGVQPLFAVLLAVIAGGGVGNQLDRLFRSGGWNKGAVVDFIDVGVFNFAIFNVADMALSVGCAILAVWTLLGGGPSEPPSPVALDAPGSVGASSSEGLRSTASHNDTKDARCLLDSTGADGHEADCSPSSIEGVASPGQRCAPSDESSTKGR